ncbi:N-acetylneuraminate synthase family protein [Falsiroseomonas sp.]|uniref:N-acetylneuraminate synthase family protein n=1 Tax=Falsiroseomonas sp. TaxID=2870721 RepID=UPI0034A17B78
MQIEINGRAVGDGHPSFIIAEIGSNHNGDLGLALRHVDAAVEAGADAVKFQTFKASSHYSRRTPDVDYLKGVSIYGLIESIEIDRGWHTPLMEHAKQQGVIFLSSPCDPEAIAELSALGMAANKVASFDVTDLDLVRLCAETGKPVILSTGMADWMEIQRAVETCRAVGNNDIVLLQCTSLYPAPSELSNLAAMKVMRDAFGVLTGYSDHTMGEHIPLASVAMGGCMIEKHFTLDRAMPGPDHRFAMEPGEFAAMVRHVREVERAIGDGSKAGPRPEEADMYEKCRRSLHAARAIQPGEVISHEMLTAKRPGLGIPPHMVAHVVGRTAKVLIEPDEWITWRHL